MTRSSRCCAGKAWTSPAGPWPNTARRCASPARCSASGRRPCRPERSRRDADRRIAASRHPVRRAVPNSGGEDKRMQITVSGKQVDLSDALRTRVAQQLDDVAGQIFRSCAGGPGHLQPGAQLLHLRHQPARRPRPDAARRRRGRGRPQRVRRRRRTHRQAAAPLPPARQRARARPGPTRNGRRRRGIHPARRRRRPMRAGGRRAPPGRRPTPPSSPRRPPRSRCCR